MSASTLRDQLRDGACSVVVIEHDLDVIAEADCVIDLRTPARTAAAR